MKLSSIGVLGVGYTATRLLETYSWAEDSWGTYRQKSNRLKLPSSIPTYVLFVWNDPTTWKNIPEHPVTLVVSIPPIYEKEEIEKKRLENWCEWMRQKRPQVRKMIYLSTTGVYPQEEQVWKESMTFEGVTHSAKLRLMTEHILSQFFELTIIRPGGIYGRGRNLLQRIMDHRSLPKSSRFIHRIHVEDLAGVLRSCVDQNLQEEVINVVDQFACPSVEVLQWLVEHQQLQEESWKTTKAEILACIQNTPGDTIRKRVISNEKLIQKLKYTFKYPTYQEGYESFLADFT